MLWKGFQRPKRLEFERETLTDRFGRFYAQPFERGFGTTIGNALRRVLLSSIEGAAITAVSLIDSTHYEITVNLDFPIASARSLGIDQLVNVKRPLLYAATETGATPNVGTDLISVTSMQYDSLVPNRVKMVDGTGSVTSQDVDCGAAQATCCCT
jgi:hypothetical protein